MSPFITVLLIIFLSSFTIVIIFEFILSRALKLFVVQMAILLGVIEMLNMTTGFPVARIAFGGVTPILAIGIMFVSTLLGIAGHSFYYLKGKFVFRTFLKPFFLSPIVLLPLIGSVQGTIEIQSVQMISYGFLAFQNGFFWKEVFEHAKGSI